MRQRSLRLVEMAEVARLKDPQWVLALRRHVRRVAKHDVGESDRLPASSGPHRLVECGGEDLEDVPRVVTADRVVRQATRLAATTRQQAFENASVQPAPTN